MIQLVAKVPIGIIPIAVQGSRGTQPVNQSVLSLFLFPSGCAKLLSVFRFLLDSLLDRVFCDLVLSNYIYKNLDSFYFLDLESVCILPKELWSLCFRSSKFVQWS